MSELKDLFNQKIANDKYKDQLFDKMHAELVKYQQGSVDKMVDDMAMDVILLSDTTKQIINKYKDSVGEDRYNNTMDIYEEDKQGVKDVYDTYKPYIEEGKEKTKSAISKAKDKVSSWYKNYKESSD